MSFGVTDDGERADNQQLAQVSVALLGDAAEPLIAATGVLLRHESDPGREVATGLEGMRIGNAGSAMCALIVLDSLILSRIRVIRVR